MRHKKKGGHVLRAVRNEMRHNARVLAFVAGKKLRTPSRHTVECLWHGVLHKPNNEAPHSHLRSHIEKLGNHALDQMRMRHHLAEALARPFFGIAGLARRNLWKVYKINQGSNQEKNGGNHQVRHFHHVRFRGYIRLNFERTHCSSLSWGMLDSGKDKRRAHGKHQHSPYRVERLSEIEPAFRTLWRTKNRHLGIGSNFEK